MLVNRDNYEMYVLDFLDGKLSGKEKEIFGRFLRDNPDIMEEIMNIEQIKLVPENIRYTEKDILKKATGKENVKIKKTKFQHNSIAYFEGDLSSSEMKEFEAYLSKYPGKRSDFESFGKVYLKPDINIVFPSKSKLRRLSIRQQRYRVISYISGAAAILIIALILVQPGKNYFDQLVTRRNADTGAPDEQTTEITQENVREENLAEQGNQKNLDKALQETTIAQISTNEQTKKEIFIPSEEVRMQETREMETISLKPIPSVQADLQARIPDIVDGLSVIGMEKTPKPGEYMTLTQFAGSQLQRDFVQRTNSGQDQKLTFWTIAYNGFNGLDRISESNYALNREVDEDGSVKRIILETPLIGLSLPVKSSKSPQ